MYIIILYLTCIYLLTSGITTVELLKSKSISDEQVSKCLNKRCFTAGSIIEDPAERSVPVPALHICSSGHSKNLVTYDKI